MPFAIEMCYDIKGVVWEEPEIYDCFDNMMDVLIYLGSEWVAGDMELPNTFTFLAAHGRDFGITDDEVDEGTDSALLERAMEAVLDLCADNEAVTREYLIAIGGQVRITEVEDERSEATEDERSEAEDE